MEHITIHWATGCINLDLDEFFPTGTPQLRKLLKVIDEDYEHREGLRAAIVRHCTRQAQALMDGRSDRANRAVNYHTKATELQPEIDKMARQVDALQQYIKTYCKQGGGQGYRQQLKELKAQMKDIREQQRHALTLYRDYQRQYASAERTAERLRKNAEVTGYGR